MPAREISRTKDFQRGLIMVLIDDGYGHTVPHTVNVLGVPDVEQDIADAVTRIEQQADAKALIFEAVGL
jgi:hypothetical protein